MTPRAWSYGLLFAGIAWVLIFGALAVVVTVVGG
jgi:hypothetical protein